MLEVTVRKRRLRWFGHVQWMEDSRRAKQALEWIPDEKKKRGRPRITGRDTVWRDVECMNMTWEDVCHEATDRKKWKNGLPNVLQAQEGLRSKVRTQHITAAPCHHKVSVLKLKQSWC